MIFVKNMIKRLPAFPFVRQTSVSTAIVSYDNTHLLSFQHFPQLQTCILDKRLSLIQNSGWYDKYSCIDLFNRKTFFLNYFFKDIDLCSRSVFFVINEQKDNVSIHFLCDEIVSDDPCAAIFPFVFLTLLPFVSCGCLVLILHLVWGFQEAICRN